MGYPSPGMLAYALWSGAIRDAHFTANDMTKADATLGEDLARLKGKSVRPPTVPNVLDMDGTKSALKQQDLFIDNFHLESRWFLLSVVAPMGQLLVSGLSCKHDTRVCQAKVQRLIDVG
jgi:hypothetical protein